MSALLFGQREEEVVWSKSAMKNGLLAIAAGFGLVFGTAQYPRRSLKQGEYGFIGTFTHTTGRSRRRRREDLQFL
jgi:hypothetical protein